MKTKEKVKKKKKVKQQVVHQMAQQIENDVLSGRSVQSRASSRIELNIHEVHAPNSRLSMSSNCLSGGSLTAVNRREGNPDLANEDQVVCHWPINLEATDRSLRVGDARKKDLDPIMPQIQQVDIAELERFS